MSLYKILIVIHILSAILGLGPGFVLTYIVMKAQNMTELRHVYRLRVHLHILVMIGGTLLLITGIWMGILNPSLWSAFWYTASLFLFMVGLAFGPLILRPSLAPIKKILNEAQTEEIPEAYKVHAKRLFRQEHIVNIIFIIIIVLMVLRPTFK